MPDVWKSLASLLVLALTLGLASLLLTGPARLTPAAKRQERIPRLVRKDQPLPSVSAEAVLVTRLKTGEVMYERNADRQLPVASLTKLMTVLLVAETERPLELVSFSLSAKRSGNADDKRSAVEAGDALKAEDVLKLLLISSDNDAAYAAAEHVAALSRPDLRNASSEDRVRMFVARMNERAAELGLAKTRFSNPAGRDDPENFSTARDITTLTNFIHRHRAELWTISRVQETFVFGKTNRRYGVVNTNPLLGEFPALYGSKTGLDDEAKGTLVMLYQMAPDDIVALTLLRSQDRFGDGRALLGWVESSFMLESM